MAANQNNNSDNKKKDYIGVTKLKGHTLKFYYIGGSRIGIEYDTGQQATTNKKVFDAMVAKKQVRITDMKRWGEICAEIRPDGSTKTHNADGSEKSAVQQTLGDLIEENYVAKNADGSFRIPSDDSAGKAVKAPVKDVKKAADILNSKSPVQPGTMKGNQQDDEPKAEKSRIPHVPVAPVDDEPRDEYEEEINDGIEDEPQPIYEQREEPIRKQPAVDARDRRDKRMAGDLNGDGIVDEFDGLIKQEQQKNGFVMVVFFSAIILSTFLFFFVHSVVSMALHGNDFQLFPSSNDPVTEQVQQGDEQSASEDQQDEGDGGSSDDKSAIETVTRTDFDPESAVINMPMASDENELIARTLIKMIKEDINNGDVKSFNEAVDIEQIAGQVAPEYAWRAAEIQGMTDVQRQEMMEFYHQTFRDNERQHVVNKDPYASIFGGRIREVRQDKNDANKLYVVMESISGDHQRICFVMQGDDSGAWVINGITDARGYVRMVQTGVVE